MKISHFYLALFALIGTIATSASLSALGTFGIHFPQAIFLAITILLTALIIFIVYYVFYRSIYRNNNYEIAPYITILFLYFLVAFKLGISGFSEDDEIYSWNYWAVQHYLGLEASFQFTHAPYPQLLPHWLSSLYSSIGNANVQFIPRIFLATSTLIVATSIAFINSIETRRASWLTTLSILFAIAPVLPWYAQGLADPLMTATLTGSAFFLITYAKNTRNVKYLYFSVICGIISSLTKQPGIFWACFSLPVIAIAGWRFLNWPRMAVVISFIGAVIGAIWPVLIAPTFTSNAGVISASLRDRGVYEQIIFLTNEYFITHPEILLLISGGAFFCFRQKLLKYIFFAACLPMLLLWFTFGSYAIRLGAHVLTLSALLLIAAQSVTTPSEPTVQSKNSNRKNKFLAFYSTVIFLSTLSASIVYFAPKVGTVLTDSALTTLEVQYGKESREFFEKILVEKPGILSMSAYAYAPFYNRLPIEMPRTTSQNITAIDIKNDIIFFESDYVIQTPSILGGLNSDALDKLLEACQDSFMKILKPPNQKNFTLYSVDRAKLQESSCQ